MTTLRYMDDEVESQDLTLSLIENVRQVFGHVENRSNGGCSAKSPVVEEVSQQKVANSCATCSGQKSVSDKLGKVDSKKCSSCQGCDCDKNIEKKIDSPGKVKSSNDYRFSLAIDGDLIYGDIVDLIGRNENELLSDVDQIIGYLRNRKKVPSSESYRSRGAGSDPQAEQAVLPDLHAEFGFPNSDPISDYVNDLLESDSRHGSCNCPELIAKIPKTNQSEHCNHGRDAWIDGAGEWYEKDGVCKLDYTCKNYDEFCAECNFSLEQEIAFNNFCNRKQGCDHGMVGTVLRYDAQSGKCDGSILCHDGEYYDWDEALIEPCDGARVRDTQWTKTAPSCDGETEVQTDPFSWAWTLGGDGWEPDDCILAGGFWGESLPPALCSAIRLYDDEGNAYNCGPFKQFGKQWLPLIGCKYCYLPDNTKTLTCSYE